ncbi:MAG: phytoene/squalene synthase family protein [Verrucomicrobia bacterium]|nr:phytoene/squalene synthase family protein [Verrucomicrobiota bacterium]
MSATPAGCNRPDRTAQSMLEASERYCRENTRRHARSFYFASFTLPERKKVAAYSIYAFCRYLDDLIDQHRPGVDGAALVTRVRDEFARLVSGEVAVPPFALAFANTVKLYRIPPEPFLDLTRGVLMDTGPVALQTWDDLRRYCYHVASVVGLAMCPVLGLAGNHGAEQAVELGIAMQLTNILRDIREDWERGRVYLPADELARFGVDVEDLARCRVTEPFRQLMQFQIARARAFYLRSEASIPMLADDGSQLTVWMMRHLYAGILEEIEKQNFDVFRQRAGTSLARKVALAGRAYRDYRRTRANRGSAVAC